MQPRLIIALAIEDPSDAIWGRIRMFADEIFSAPTIAVKLAYYGREGPGATRRPCITTDWVTVADDWIDIVDQQDRSNPTERAFRALAEVGGGVCQINPHVDLIAQRLPKMMEAITDYAVGGKAALKARDDESANLLLEQMTAADRTLARSR